MFNNNIQLFNVVVGLTDRQLSESKDVKQKEEPQRVEDTPAIQFVEENLQFTLEFTFIHCQESRSEH